MHATVVKLLSSLCFIDEDLVTSVIPSCSNNSAAVEVVARSYDDIRSEDSDHVSILIRIDYICIGEDGQQVSDNLQVWGGHLMAKKVSNSLQCHL